MVGLSHRGDTLPVPLGSAPICALQSGCLRGSVWLNLKGVCSWARKVGCSVTAVKSNISIPVTGELACAVHGTYGCEAAF